MDIFSREQQVYDTAVATLLKTEDVASFDLSHYGKLVEEYGKLLKHYREYRGLTERTNTNRLDTAKHEILNNVHFDVLTGIFNRRYLNENLDHVLLDMGRVDDTLSVIVVDIDHFKLYNDTYGSEAGDDCLRYIAEALKSCLYRGNDFVSRYGGEEFMAILPFTNEDGARLVAERMITQVRSLAIPHKTSNVSDIVTISIGVVTGVNSALKWTAASFFKRADEALYQAKEGGRNQYAYLGLHP